MIQGISSSVTVRRRTLASAASPLVNREMEDVDASGLASLIGEIWRNEALEKDARYFGSVTIGESRN